MEWTIDVLQQIWGACLQLLGQPFYYIGLCFVVLLYRREIVLERKLFLTKLHSFLDQTWKTLLWGIIAGFVVSCVMLVFDIRIQAEAVILIWIITLLIVLFRARFFCFAYAIGIVGMAHAVVVTFPLETDVVLLDKLLTGLAQLHMPTLLTLVAVTHLLESILMRRSSARSASPIVVRGKRGRLIGGYHIEGFWTLPLFLMIPVSTHTKLDSLGDSANGLYSFVGELGPLWGAAIWSNGWTLLAFPFVIGFSVWTTSVLPEQKAKWTSSYILLYSAVVLALALGVAYWPPLAFTASLLCILLHEAIVWYSAWKESQQSPRFVHDKRSLFILGIIAGSPAEELGIEVGESIRQVNGFKVTTKEELHEAFNASPAFCKLEIINLEGQSKFLQRPIYSGEHHQLGMILAPNDNTDHYLKKTDTSIISYITLKDVK